MQIKVGSAAIPTPTYTPKAKCVDDGVSGSTVSMSYASACGGTCIADATLFSGTFSPYFTADLAATWECCLGGMDVLTTLELSVKLINYDTENDESDYDIVTITFNGGAAFGTPSLEDFEINPIASA